MDLYKENKLHELINSISKVEGVEWIRLLYCYPEEITDELIEEMANNKKVVKYLDLPIQHISDNILRKMARRTNKETIIAKIEKLRKRIPGIALRTSLIVGFPGETEEDFKELCKFLEEYKLDNVGVFKYSKEEGTPAANMAEQIDDETKERRQDELMLIQKKVVEKLNKLKISKVYDTIIEREKGKFFIGRSSEMAPEIDGTILVKSKDRLEKGDMVKVIITEALEYDLVGEIYDEFSK